MWNNLFFFCTAQVLLDKIWKSENEMFTMTGMSEVNIFTGIISSQKNFAHQDFAGQNIFDISNIHTGWFTMLSQPSSVAVVVWVRPLKLHRLFWLVFRNLVGKHLLEFTRKFSFAFLQTWKKIKSFRGRVLWVSITSPGSVTHSVCIFYRPHSPSVTLVYNPNKLYVFFWKKGFITVTET